MDRVWKAHVIVVGNLKGGSGKSTIAIHIALALMDAGRSVVCVDADVHQHSLGRFLENRRATSVATRRDLPLPALATFDREPSALDHRFHQDARQMVERFSAMHDVVLIDTPGSDTVISRAVHRLADTIITPINDSFVDLDVLARVEPGGGCDAEAIRTTNVGVYTDLVHIARERRMHRDGAAIDWIVVRNRLTHVGSRNKRHVEGVVRRLAEPLEFRVAAGFGERVIFRELFPRGLTLLDMGEKAGGDPLTLSQVAARQELRGLVNTLRLPTPRVCIQPAPPAVTAA